MEFAIKTPQDRAEDLVCRWYSLTRGSDIERPFVMRLLYSLVINHLLKQQVEPYRAKELADQAIFEWVEECEGLNCNSILVFEVLVEKIRQIIL